ncbi:MAG: DUF1109 domain-containing protein [Burkholderiales bacterium]|nr:DUF1109 domain-containing protein [Burkholderiales bacterium]MDE2626715.1 DUF1109 domain-containing protein [Burkholderiales bacterium]
MKTVDLIAALATGAGPAPRAVAARRLAPVALAGGLIAGLAAVALMGRAPATTAIEAALWMKFGYAGLVAAAAGWLAARLARPASSVVAPLCLLGVVIGGMGVLGVVAMWRLPGTERMAYLFGNSWTVCPWNVLGLSLPALAGTLWAVRGLAPTRPRAAGLAAGLLAGAVGALGYALSCPEVSITFVAVWYSLGIALVGGAGAALGPRVLRW